MPFYVFLWLSCCILRQVLSYFSCSGECCNTILLWSFGNVLRSAPDFHQAWGWADRNWIFISGWTVPFTERAVEVIIIESFTVHQSVQGVRCWAPACLLLPAWCFAALLCMCASLRWECGFMCGCKATQQKLQLLCCLVLGHCAECALLNAAHIVNSHPFALTICRRPAWASLHSLSTSCGCHLVL